MLLEGQIGINPEGKILAKSLLFSKIIKVMPGVSKTKKT